MTFIAKNEDLVTFINVFRVAPASQHRVVDLLQTVTAGYVRHAPGFVSASLHRSLDGTKVTMYAQWLSLEDYHAMRYEETPGSPLEELLGLASFEPGMYEVVETYSPPGPVD
jgi:hypothetical protein